MRRIPCVVCCALAMAAAGCQRGDVTLGISDSTFVATMAQLHTINADTLLDSTARAGARAVVLREHGVTAEALERAARAMASNPDHALAVWTAIDHRVRDTTDTAAR